MKINIRKKNVMQGYQNIGKGIRILGEVAKDWLKINTNIKAYIWKELSICKYVKL